jgi:hypothetical protein
MEAKFEDFARESLNVAVQAYASAWTPERDESEATISAALLMLTNAGEVEICPQRIVDVVMKDSGRALLRMLVSKALADVAQAVVFITEAWYSKMSDEQLQARESLPPELRPDLGEVEGTTTGILATLYTKDADYIYCQEMADGQPVGEVQELHQRQMTGNLVLHPREGVLQ